MRPRSCEPKWTTAGSAESRSTRCSTRRATRRATPPRLLADYPAGLTEREVEVLRLIAKGQANKQVAAQLGISRKTVGHHIEHIYAKAGVTTRAGATLFAMEHRLLSS